MGQDSKIEWTDHTFNPWWGCTHVHEGCRHCYAETWAKRFGVTWGPSGVRRVASEKQWAEPLKWNRLAEKAGVRAKVFCASMADVFEDSPIQLCHQSAPEIKMWKMNEPNGHDWQWGAGVVLDDPSSGVPLTLDDVRKRLFALIDQTPWLDWQLVTKRPENIRRMWPSADLFDDRSEHKAYWQNVWLLTSVSHQASADKQIPELLQCHDLSPVLGLSCEPLLGPIDLTRVGNHDGTCANLFDGNCLYVGDIGGAEYAWSPRNMLRWVIVGGESGHEARPMHPEWARALRDQCQAARVPFFFKQWGEWSPLEGDPGRCETVRIDSSGRDVTGLHGLHDESNAVLVREGKKLAGRILDGRTWDEFPEVIHADCH